MAGKNLRKPPRAARRKTTAAVLLAAFGCGVGSCMLLLAACAFFADAYGATAGPRAADGLYGSCSGGGSIRSSSVASVQGKAAFVRAGLWCILHGLSAGGITARGLRSKLAGQ